MGIYGYDHDIYLSYQHRYNQHIPTGNWESVVRGLIAMAHNDFTDPLSRFPLYP